MFLRALNRALLGASLAALVFAIGCNDSRMGGSGGMHTPGSQDNPPSVGKKSAGDVTKAPSESGAGRQPGSDSK